MLTISEMQLIELKEYWMKEKKIGQTADWTILPPFMRVTSNDNYSTPTSNSGGVTFDAMETL